MFGTEWDFIQYAIFNASQIKIRFICHIELTADTPPNRVAEPVHLPFGEVVARGIWKYSSGKRWVEYDRNSSEVM